MTVVPTEEEGDPDVDIDGDFMTAQPVDVAALPLCVTLSQVRRDSGSGRAAGH